MDNVNPHVRNLTTRGKLMKIVFLGTRGFPNVQGGVEKHCENLAVQLVNLGCEVIVLTREPYVDKTLAEFKGVKLVPLPAVKLKSSEAFLHTLVGVFAARRFKPDILHFQAIGPSLFAPLARFLGMKVVVTTHGPDYQREKWGVFAKLVLRLGEFLGATFAHKLIAISPNIAAEVFKKYQREAVVIPNGVALPEIKTSEDSLGRYGLRKGQYFLAVGRFVPEKGFHDLVEAFNRRRDFAGSRESDSWKLVIVGDADHESEYSRRLREVAGGNGDIILTGFLGGQPLQELYSHAGLFVLPSYYEGLPIVLLEALSYGLPCLLSDIPANRAVEIDLPEERYFHPGDITDLGRKLAEFVSRPGPDNERQAFAQRIKEIYDWKKTAQKTMEVYTSISRKPKP